MQAPRSVVHPQHPAEALQGLPALGTDQVRNNPRYIPRRGAQRGKSARWFDQRESELTRRGVRGTGKMALDAGIRDRSALVRLAVPRLFNGCQRADRLPPR